MALALRNATRSDTIMGRTRAIRQHQLCFNLCRCAVGRGRSRSERLAVGKLDRISVRIDDAAVIADGKRLPARWPEQQPPAPRLFGDGVHLLCAAAGEAQMPVIVVPTPAAMPSTEKDEYERCLSARFGKPGNRLSGVIEPFMHDDKTAKVLIESNRLADVPHVQGNVGQRRGHGIAYTVALTPCPAADTAGDRRPFYPCASRNGVAASRRCQNCRPRR